MELILHIGLNKTGSSAIQSHLAINRNKLLEHGLWFVESKEDQKMFEGEISAGNGLDLVRIIHEKDKKELINYFNELVVGGEILGVSKILLSNEALIRMFAYDDILDLLEQAKIESKISSITCIGILRPPLEHALSLFKHRGKKGDFSDFKFWFETNYETLELFRSFLQHYKNYNFNWVFLQYTRESDFLLNQFYKKIGIELNSHTFKLLQRKVNTSLSLDSILFLSFLKNLYPHLGSYFYDIIKNEDNNLPENETLISKFVYVANHYFIEFKDTIDSMGVLINDESWANNSIANYTENVTNNEIRVSDSDLALLKKLIANPLYYNYLNFKYYFKKLVGSYASSIYNKKIKFNTLRYGGNMRI